MARDTSRSRGFGLPGLLFLVLLLAALAGCQAGPQPIGDNPNSEGRLTVVAFDVGQADSILVVTPGGKAMLVDAGNSKDDADSVILPFLRQHGINRLDYLVLTHPHQDHVGGMPQVLRSLDVSVAVFSGEISANSTYQQFLSIIREHNIRALQARRGKSLDLGPDVRAEILNPPEQFFAEMNDNSVVVRVVWRDTSVLLMGDVETEAERSILESGAEISSTILKVGHHGSGTSSSAQFLDAVRPRYAVISVGAGNDYGHPHERTLEALSRRNVATFRTDLNGTVVFVSNGTEVAVSTEKR